MENLKEKEECVDERRIHLKVNGTQYEEMAETRMTLVDFLREKLGLTGTHIGCEHGVCGACTVLLDGQPVRSCSTPVSGVAGHKVTTIEGVGATPVGKALQAAWVAHDVPQCGYCQSGQIMAAVALLAKKARPSDADIDEVMRGNICRCGTYQSIRAAIHRASEIMTASTGEQKGRVA